MYFPGEAQPAAHLVLNGQPNFDLYIHIFDEYMHPSFPKYTHLFYLHFQITIIGTIQLVEI